MTTTASKPSQPPVGAHTPLRERVAWLWRYWRPHRSVMVFLFFFTLVSTTVAVAYPLVLRWVIDRVNEVLATGAASTPLTQVFLVLAGILAGRFIAGFYPAFRALMNLRLERDIREEVFGRLMRKDYRFNTRFRTGDVVTRLTDDVAEFPKIAWFGCSGVFRAIESSSKMVFCLAAMAIIDWQLTLAAVIPLPIMMWLFYSLRHRIRRLMRASQQSISETNDLLEAAFSGIRIVKAFRGEEGQQGRLARLMEERVGIFFDLRRLQVLLHSLDTVASRVGQMIVIALGGFMVIRGELTIGTLVAFYLYLDMLTHPMMDIPFLFMTGQQAFISIDRVEELRAFPARERGVGGARIEEIETIAFENVSFHYDAARPILDRVSFSVPLGGKIAIVGPVASGKSTLLKLLAGILEPSEGRLAVNGRSLAEWDWDSYRHQIGYVPQEGVLFSETIAENVLFGRPAPTDQPSADAWVRRCLSIAQMDEDLQELPAGPATVVGQKGGLVSGGQKQRVAIARALAGRPQVLLLDDCTAALDARNEDHFWAELETEFGGGTSVIVSHRLATIRRADVILVLEGGRLVDQGSHEELAMRCETYREFLQTERAKSHLGRLNAQPAT